METEIFFFFELFDQVSTEVVAFDLTLEGKGRKVFFQAQLTMVEIQRYRELTMHFILHEV